MGVERFVSVHGRNLRVRSHGTGRPVLLINGLGANVATWTPLINVFDGVQVISFDAPGVGRSDSPRMPYTISRVADVAARVLDEFNLDQVDVVGYSLGGAVAQRLALDHPERVRRLALVSTACGLGGVPGALRALLAVSTPVRHFHQSGYEAVMKLIDLAPAEKQSAFLSQQGAWHKEAVPSVRGYTLQMGAFTTFNSLPWLHRIEHPTLVLSGAQDNLVPLANAAILAAYLPQARMQVFEDWGHYMLADPASGAGAAIAEFFRAEDHESSAAWTRARTVSTDAMETLIRTAPRSAHIGSVTGGWVRRMYPLRLRKD